LACCWEIGENLLFWGGSFFSAPLLCASDLHPSVCFADRFKTVNIFDHFFLIRSTKRYSAWLLRHQYHRRWKGATPPPWCTPPRSPKRGFVSFREHSMRVCCDNLISFFFASAFPSNWPINPIITSQWKFGLKRSWTLKEN
jgi:hypothetical protein